MGKVLFANPKKSHGALTAFARSDGPGLCVLLWKSSIQDGEPPDFIDELECDCRGKIDILDPTNRESLPVAVVMGAEIKRSSSGLFCFVFVFLSNCFSNSTVLFSVW